jgi:thiamine-phosphate pyrophosphorylase
MVRRQPPLPAKLPGLWLISDARNDAGLEAMLAKLPRGSGFIYRHYHLNPEARHMRFERLARLARRRTHIVILSGTSREARRWDADGNYCAPAKAGASGLGRVAFKGTRSPPSRGRRLKLVTAHSLREIAAAHRAGAAASVLSPVFPTRSHPGARTLGPIRFRLLAARAQVPVIALGGMNPRRARRLRTARWAAIDGICAEAQLWIPTDS